MADLMNELASKSGISLDMAKKGLGTLLAALKHALPAEAFAKIEGAIPGAAQLLALATPPEGQSSGGILDAVKSLAGKLFGSAGEGPAALAAHFGQLGFSAEQIKNFLPQVIEFLKGKLPADLMKQIAGVLPSGVEKAG
jgi:hypothetical protein